MTDLLAPVVGTLLSIFTLIYIVFLTRVRLGLQSLSHQRTLNVHPSVSVVIAARNEEDTIGPCLRSVLAQDYPPELFDIIVVDDRSDDGTAEVVSALAREHPQVRLAASPSGSETAAAGKAAALRRGIGMARGECIATTDADCTVPRGWLTAMVAQFRPGVGIVSGPLVEQPRDTLFSRMEALEFFGLIAVGGGLIAAGRPIICNGANLAFFRTAYDAVGGYGEGPEANDDEGLMNRIVHRRAGAAAFAATKDALVRTASDNTAWRFFLQRARWASKRGRYEDKSILVTLVAVYLFFLVLFIALVAVAVEPLLALPVGIVLAGKALLDFLTLRSAGKILGVSIPVVPFLIAELLHVPYIVCAAAVGQFVRTSWKS